MVCYAFHQTTLCGRDVEPPRILPLLDDVAAYAMAQTMIATGNRVVEVWRGEALVWRFECATQNCDEICQKPAFAGRPGFEYWRPACSMHPLNMALAQANAEESVAAA